jgi:hypothetical protein
MAMINTLQLAAPKNLIQMSSDVLITIVTVIPDFQGTYQQLALIILFFPEKQRVQKQAWHNSRINASVY